MLAFGKLTDLSIILEQIGAIALAAHEAKQEQDGTVVRPLPVATDPRFVIEPVEETPAEEPVTDPETEEPEETPAEDQPEAEEPVAEDPEETAVTEEV